MIILLIWLAGYIINYFLIRTMIRKEDIWTVGERVFALIVSAISFPGLLLAGLCILADKNIEGDKPASW